VFEQIDEEELLRETPQVQSEVEDETVGQASMQFSGEAPDTSDLEKELHDDEPVKVTCRCAKDKNTGKPLGSCRPGESRCSRCEEGWSGEGCATPEPTNLDFEAVGGSRRGQTTKGGLYRPEKISEASLVSSSRSSDDSPRKPQRIETDSSASSPVTPASVPTPTALADQVPESAQPLISQDSSQGNNSAQSYAIIVLIMFVLYALNNGLSCPEFLFKSRSSQRSQGRSYKPLAARQDEEQDESDEEVDPQARRIMELSSLGSQERPNVDSHEYAESRQPQNQRAFPMQNVNTGKKALPKRDEGLNPPEETDAVEL
jgi:hypothetical protein